MNHHLRKISPCTISKANRRIHLRLKVSPKLTLWICFLFISLQSYAQTPSVPATTFSIGVKAGYDLPLFQTPYKELSYSGNLYWGGNLDVRFRSGFGIRADYANIRTAPSIKIPNQIYFGTTPAPTTNSQIDLKRQFLGIGPSYSLFLGSPRFSATIAPLGGYSFISGGDAYSESVNPTSLLAETQLINTGFKDRVLSGKLDIDFSFAFSKNLSLTLGFYYLRHFAVDLDHNLDVGPIGTPLIAHGENVYDHTLNPYTTSSSPPLVLPQGPTDHNCMDLASAGVNLGLKWTFGHAARKQACSNCSCPNDKHKVVVTVRDKPTQKVIPDADVAIKDMSGKIIATGKTNAFGVVDFGEIPHGNYTINGLVYDVATSTTPLLENEFAPNAIIQKEILYDDIRFILKGKVVNRKNSQPEQSVVVSLTNNASGDVKQDNSDGLGEFVFHLDKNSSYEVVGVKENRLSDIAQTTTIGLTRSTTLFVDLRLGVENFDCDQGTVLDIKYDLAEDKLLPESKFDLNRLARYMIDHPSSQVELSSHTDSRGSETYNLGLSNRRAKSAVDYIIQKGISRDRIIAQGYGESRLLNRCSDGVSCTEEEHRVNRRTEAKLLCH